MLWLPFDCGIVFVGLTKDLFHSFLLIKIRILSKLMVEMSTGLYDVTINKLCLRVLSQVYTETRTGSDICRV